MIGVADEIKLAERDLAMFAALGIDTELLLRAGVQRVSDPEAREEYGIRGSGDMAGVIFPYFPPGIGGCPPDPRHRWTARVRRDNHEIEHGEPKNKYISAWGDSRHLYFPPGSKELLEDGSVPICFVEAEKSGLAGTAWAQRQGRRMLFVALGGCWCWKGRIGKVENSRGVLVDEVGPLRDLQCASNGRKVYVLFDANANTNPRVKKARAELCGHLREQGADVSVLDLPQVENVNGPDDFIRECGDAALANIFESRVVVSGQQLDSLEAPDGLNVTQLGNANRLVRDYGQNIRWVHGQSHKSAGTFYVWNEEEGRWREDARAEVVKLAERTVSGLRELVIKAIEAQWSPQSITALTKFWKTSEGREMVEAMLALARPSLAIDQSVFDSKPMLLGVQNGVINLEDGSFREARREDYLTKQMATIYDPAATCPRWLQFLRETNDGDAEMIRYLQQIAGLSLSGITTNELFFIVTGPAATGKTTFAEVLQEVWGDYACGFDPNALAAAKEARSRPRPEIAKLPGMRLVFANESRAGLRIDEGLLKTLSAYGTVTVRDLFKGEFDFLPMYKFFLITNYAPVFDGGDSGMQRRIRRIPFESVVDPNRRDLHLREKLLAERAGILNWALVGLKDYQENGLITPKRITDTTKEYLEELDSIHQFILAHCEVGGAYEQPAKPLYDEYRKWTLEQGQFPHSHNRFAEELRGKGFTSRILEGRKVWRGLRLRR